MTNAIEIRSGSVNAKRKNNKILAYLNQKLQLVFQSLIIKSCFIINNQTINKIILFFVGSLALWAFMYLAIGVNALPGGICFSLFVLIFSCHLVGYLFEKIKMPNLLGMLLVGLFFRNVPVLSIVGKSIDSSTSAILRNMSFCVILCKAGLTLNLPSLGQQKLKILKLSCMPCLIETLAIAGSSYLILKFSVAWAFLLGFIISNVSPAVVVPSMIDLEEKRIGTNKNIPSLAIASSCLDNILAISGHSLIIGILFNKGAIWWIILQYPLQIFIGLIYGLVVGIFLSIIRLDHAIKLSTLRFIILLIFSLISLIGSKKISFISAGPLGVLTLSIVARLIWNKVDRNTVITRNSEDNLMENYIVNNEKEVTELFTKLWSFIFLPLLFSLIGNEIDFEKLSFNIIGLGTGIICIGLVFRMITTYLSVSLSDLINKERLFMCFVWIPKATIQAAIGSISLDYARENKDVEKIDFGFKVLNIAVLSIILTAPLGTLLISLTAPRLLKKEKNDFTEHIEISEI